jgi:hypothetical protein
MPQQSWYPAYYNNAYYNTSATTTNYVVQQPTWMMQTASNASITYYQPTYSNTSIYTANNWWTDEVWQQWVTVPQTYGYAQGQFRVETPEEIEAHRERRERERQERQVARTRARVLLGEFLSEEQNAELERHGRFHVTGSRGRRYCIRAEGQAGNVDLLKPDGSLQARLCCHPREGLPEGDAWLMQMIEIRHDEDHFLRTANVHRGSLPVAA